MASIEPMLGHRSKHGLHMIGGDTAGSLQQSPGFGGPEQPLGCSWAEAWPLLTAGFNQIEDVVDEGWRHGLCVHGLSGLEQILG